MLEAWPRGAVALKRSNGAGIKPPPWGWEQIHCAGSWGSVLGGGPEESGHRGGLLGLLGCDWCGSNTMGLSQPLCSSPASLQAGGCCIPGHSSHRGAQAQGRSRESGSAGQGQCLVPSMAATPHTQLRVCDHNSPWIKMPGIVPAGMGIVCS